MELDEETLAQLGWGTDEEREDKLNVTRLGGRPSRTPTGEVDGRSKARDRVAMSVAYWARKKAA